MCASTQRRTTVRTYVIFILMLIGKSTSIPTTNPALCHCIRVKDCQPFTDRLLNHEPHERVGLFEGIRDATCGFEQGNSDQPLVCCPSNFFLSTRGSERNDKDNDDNEAGYVRRMSRTTFEDDNHESRQINPWVWGRTPLLTTSVKDNDDNEAGFVRRLGRTVFANDNQGSRQLDPWVWGRTPLVKTARESDSIADKFNNLSDDQNNFGSGVKHMEDQRNTNTKRHHNGPHAIGFEDDEEDNFHHNLEQDLVDEHAHHHHHPHNHDDCNSNSFVQMSNTFESDGDSEPKYPAYKIIFPSTPSRKSKPLSQPTPTVPPSSSDSSANPASSSPTPPSTSQPLATFNNSVECGTSVGNRVLGGTDATPGQFPWIARIGYLNRTSNDISYRCSGSAVSVFYILTAAHCVQDLGSEWRLFHILIGDDAQASRTFNISNTISHPNYNQPRFANDIALVRIDRPQTMEASFGFICLPLDNSEGFANRLTGGTGVVAGWNSSNNSDANAIVKLLRLPIVNTTECAIGYAMRSEQFEVPIVIAPSQICAQGQPMQDSCQGDSGGPFMDDGTSGLINTDGRWTLLGIVAFGWNGCSNESNILPGVYTRVSSFIPWIAGNIS